ncbi:MAG: hypothetical protein S4CHLAM2_04940 [Chlamydiales bacterium]|nr:hypothetical protein [Chlamydiales bacterium]
MTQDVSGPQPPKRSEENKTSPIAPKDVEQYVQTHEEIQQLEAILSVAQNMVHKQLQKARAEGKSVKLKQQPLPMEGNATQKANIGTYNALQSHVGIEIQSLIKQIALLKAEHPEEGEALDAFLGELEGMAKGFPHLSEQQINTLNTLATKLNTLANQTTGPAQGAYWHEVSEMYGQMLTSNAESIKALKTQAGTQKAIDQLSKHGKVVGKAMAGAVAKKAASGALPNQFQHAILNKYMPSQEKYLMELAELLMFDNMGAQIGNALLSHITDFSGAASNYDFSNSLHKDGKGQFTGSATEKQNQLSKEISQAEKDQKALGDARQTIKDKVNAIKNNPNLTAAQKKELIDKLNAIDKNLAAAQKNIHTLITQLLGLKITKGSDSKHCKISGPFGWQKKLGQAEDAVINGVTKSGSNKPGLTEGGGLVQIAADVNTFQQTYSDQGQNQQMQLQMRMTEIQQEWTVVSTSLQVLNQMYTSIAQSIYK